MKLETGLGPGWWSQIPGRVLVHSHCLSRCSDQLVMVPRKCCMLGRLDDLHTPYLLASWFIIYLSLLEHKVQEGKDIASLGSLLYLQWLAQ